MINYWRIGAWAGTGAEENATNENHKPESEQNAKIMLSGNGFIALGYNWVGNLRNTSLDDPELNLNDHDKHVLTTFLNHDHDKYKVGISDIVVVYIPGGNLYIGKIDSDYYYEPEDGTRPHFKGKNWGPHRRNVVWGKNEDGALLQSNNINLGKGGYGKTLVHIRNTNGLVDFIHSLLKNSSFERTEVPEKSTQHSEASEAKMKIAVPSKEEFEPDDSEFEENERTVTQTRRERSPKLKEKAIEKYGKTCNICGFNFSETYGVDYIEVHHKIPLKDIPKGQATKLGDVITICANCHRAIHSKDPPFTVDELKEKLKQIKVNNFVTSS